MTAPVRRRPKDSTPDAHLFPTRPYDLVKEFVVAVVVVGVLTLLLAAVFSSPDRKALTLRSWAQAAPADVVATATAELAGTSTSAGYGPPYNSAADGQALGPLPLQRWAGVRIPVNSANDLVIAPLSTVTGDAALTAALKAWRAASTDQQASWATAYADALAAAPDGDPGKVTAGSYGPVPTLSAGLLNLARSGGLEGLLIVRYFLRRQRNEATAAAGRRRLPGRSSARRATRRRPVGNDERNRQLPRPAMDVALYLLVPDPAVFHLSQRRRAGMGPDGPTHRRLHPRSLHPRFAVTTPAPGRPPTHLAKMIQRPALPRTRCATRR